MTWLLAVVAEHGLAEGAVTAEVTDFAAIVAGHATVFLAVAAQVTSFLK